MVFEAWYEYLSSSIEDVHVYGKKMWVEMENFAPWVDRQCINDEKGIG